MIPSNQTLAENQFNSVNLQLESTIMIKVKKNTKNYTARKSSQAVKCAAKTKKHISK